MKKNKKHGFTLTEMLIALLIVSLVLAAALPTVTKRNASTDKLWKQDDSHNLYSLPTNMDNIGVYVGMESKKLESSHNDTTAIVNNFNDTTATSIVTDIVANSIMNKFVILKSAKDPLKWRRSHLSFYNQINDTHLTNVGRFTADETSMGFGILSLASGSTGENNTAYGHYTLAHNTTGSDNIALGNKALMNYGSGSNNIAIGNEALKGQVGTTAATLYPGGSNNVAIGNNAMNANTTGEHNIAVGNNALRTNRTGHYHIAIGENAMKDATPQPVGAAGTGAEPTYSNIAIGYGSIETLTEEGSHNIGIGSRALNTLIKGSNNIGIGHHALGMKDKSSYVGGEYEDNIAIGEQAMQNTTTGSQNVAIGSNAMQNQKDTGYSIAIGYGAMQNAKFNPEPVHHYESNIGIGWQSLNKIQGDSWHNIGLGAGSLQKLNEGKNNIAIGCYALQGSSNNFSDNIAIGEHAVQNTTTGSQNVAMGSNAMQNTTTGSQNVAMGSNAMNNNTTGSQNVAIGSNAGQKAKGSSNIFIGYNAASNLNDSSDGNLYIGIGDSPVIKGVKINNFSDSNSKLSIYTKLQIENAKNIEGTNGTISGFNTIDAKVLKINGQNITDLFAPSVGGGGTSDARLKNIKGDSKAGLAEINKLEVKNYTYKNDKEKRPRVGVIAQQLQKVFPNSVFKGADGYLNISREEIFYAMVNAIKELGAKIQEILAKISGLDKRITELEKQNKLLTEQNELIKKQNEQIKQQNKKIEKRLSKLEKAR